MAYTIIRSNGTVLTTIQDGTINTSSTSLGLPGRNFAGYGNTLDTNFVRLIENFASNTPPANPLKGQMWFNTDANAIYVCPADGTTTASSWIVLTSATSAGDTTLGNVTVTGNIIGNNLTVNNSTSSDTITVRMATVTANATISNAFITTGNIATTKTTFITTANTSVSGVIQNSWKSNGTGSGNSFLVDNGNLYIASGYGIKATNYMNADGSPFTPSGTYTNANVSDYLTGANSVTQFTGNIAPTKVTTSALAGGGSISGIWTLAANARIQATYADLAERYEADAIYDVGTVLEIGGDKEVTSVKEDLSEEVFGVVSTTAAYLMNSMAGEDDTHPAVALAGRVKVKVTGKIRKGQRLVSAGNGLARGASKEELTPFNNIGRALESKDDEGTGVIEAVVVIK
jgi:hypothetical protein